MALNLVQKIDLMEENSPKAYQLIDQPTFFLIGVSTRTTNEGGQSGTDINQLWQRFFAENVRERIPGKLDEDTLTLYTNYESDHNGPYTVFVGCRVASLDKIPKGMDGISVVGGSFAVYQRQGKIPDIVLGTWMNIWQETAYKRSFLGDYDVYKPGTDTENAEVEIWVGVRNRRI